MVSKNAADFFFGLILLCSFITSVLFFSAWLYNVNNFLFISWVSLFLFILISVLNVLRARLQVKRQSNIDKEDLSKFIDDLLSSKVGKG